MKLLFMNKDKYQNKATLPDQEFGQVLQLIRQTRQNLFAQANTTLMELYWHIGKIISEKVRSAAWGKGVVTALADYIARTDPDVKGFSDKNLWRMKQFYETYCNDEKLSPLVRELPWTQNTIIFSRCKSPEAREFYLTLAHKDKLNKRELERQIDAGRVATGGQKLSAALRELHPAIGNTFKDSYVLEFLGLPPLHSENRLQKALVQHMKAFILDLGSKTMKIGS
jgi:predicted nuclease of restriction endonuclease-like (RecB) superfamily